MVVLLVLPPLLLLLYHLLLLLALLLINGQKLEARLHIPLKDPFFLNSPLFSQITKFPPSHVESPWQSSTLGLQGIHDGGLVVELLPLLILLMLLVLVDDTTTNTKKV